MVREAESHTPQALTFSIVCTDRTIFKGSVHDSEHSSSFEPGCFRAWACRQTGARCVLAGSCLATSAGDRVVPGVSAGSSIRRRCDRSAEHRDTNSTRCLRPRCETMKGASVGRVLPADTWAVTRICREWRPPSTPLFQRAEEPLGGPVAEPVPQIGGEALEIGTGRPGRGGAGAAGFERLLVESERRYRDLYEEAPSAITPRASMA